MTIIVDIDIPYERLVRRHFPSVAEAVAWINANPFMYERDLERVEMYEEPVYMDVKALTKTA